MYLTMEACRELSNIFSETEIVKFNNICVSNDLKNLKKLYQKKGIYIFNDFDVKTYILSCNYFTYNFIEYIYRYKYFKLIKYLHAINSNLFEKYDIGLKYALEYGHLHIIKWLLLQNIYNTEIDYINNQKQLFYHYSYRYNHLHLIKYLLKLYPNLYIFANKILVFTRMIYVDMKKYITNMYFNLQYKSQHLQLICKNGISIYYYFKNRQIIKWMF